MKQIGFILLLLCFGPVASAELSKTALGGVQYRTCYYCHSLHADVHLTGPSLANLWGKPAGKVAGFEFYSDALKNSKLKWDEATLRKWLADPKHVVPQTSMTFAGFKQSSALDEVMEFLKIALKPGGYEKVLKEKFVSEETAKGQLPKALAQVSESDWVKGITHCRNGYTLAMGDGKSIKHWEQNIDFKVVSGVKFPGEAAAVLIPTGSMGDRFKVLFSSFDSMTKMMRECETSQGKK